MRLKRILSEIKEEWEKSVESIGGNIVDIFKNPSRKEIVEASGNRLWDDVIRYMTDIRNKDVYVWNPEEITHSEVAEEVGLSNYINYLYGMGEYREGEILTGLELLPDYASEFMLEERDIQDIKEGKYDWLKRYHFAIDKIKEVY